MPRLKQRRSGARSPRPHWDMERRRRAGAELTFEELLEANAKRLGEVARLMEAATPGMRCLDGLFGYHVADRFGFWISFPVLRAGTPLRYTAPSYPNRAADGGGSPTQPGQG